MRKKSLFILVVLSLAVLAAGCQGVSRTPGPHHHREIPESSVLYGYEGPGLTEYDRVRMEIFLGEYY